jgi:methyltransferase (TIGR00027 family)
MEAFMNDNQSSRTAETIAIHRAAEAMLPEDQRVCNDPLAIHFLSPQVLDRFKGPFRRTIARWVMNYFYPGVNGAVVARVRFMDDRLNACIQKGLEQLVIIGAGYDTRAYRLNIPDNSLRVFEVDQPATQQVKISKLKSFLSEIPGYVSFVPVDLEREKLEDKLLASGYDENQKTLFLMEGLVMYLPGAVFDELLMFIAGRSGKGSAVVFDYLPRSMVDGSVQAREGRSMYRYVVKNGEPFRFGMDAAQMDQLLSEKGFEHITNRPATDYRDAYFKGGNHNRKISKIFSFVYASKENELNSARV